MPYDKSQVAHTDDHLADYQSRAAASARRARPGAPEPPPAVRTPAGIIASVCDSLGVRVDDGMLTDFVMLERRGDFGACRQPADYARIWLRVKLQQVGEG